MGEYSKKAQTRHQAARRDGAIQAEMRVRNGDVTELAKDKDFRNAWLAGYREYMGVWGRLYGRAAAGKDAALMNADLDTGRGEPSRQPGRSKH